MKLKDRSYDVTTPSLLREVGITERMESSFINAMRTDINNQNKDKPSFIEFTNKIQGTIRRADEGLMSMACIKDVLNVYPVKIELQTPGIETSINDMLNRGFKLLVEQKELGIESTTAFSYKNKNSVVLDHSGVITLNEEGMLFKEVEKSMALVVVEGRKVAIVNQQAITVTFGA